MIITQEILETLYRKVNQYCLIQFGREPNEIVIEKDHIVVDWNTLHCYETHAIKPEDLNQDMDELEKKIKEEQERERLRLEAFNKKMIEQKARAEKELRRLKYEELRKEFGE